MKEDFKLSSFLHFLKIDPNGNIVYNSLHLKKIFCNSKTVQKIKSLDIDEDGEFFNYLLENYFIIKKSTKPEDEINSVLKERNIDFKKPYFKVFYIIPTTACNFRCKYCYLSTLINYKPRIMSIKTARKSLEYMYAYMKRVKGEPPKVVLYGGEPLSNKTTIKFIIKDIRKKTKLGKIPKTSIILITNGSLVNKEISKFLKDNRVLVAVSLDGTREINNLNRIYKNGKGTYNDAVRGIRLLNEAGIKPTISCTVNENNVNFLDKIIIWMLQNFKIDSFGLNLYTGGDCGKKNIMKLSAASTKKIIKSFEICREYGIYEDSVIRRMKGFVNETINVYSCAATGREIAIDPDGNIATCPAFLNTEMFPLNIGDRPKIEDNIEFKKWTKRSPLLNIKCYSCIALGVCGGGCAYNSYKNKANIFELDEFYCVYAKGLTKWMLKNLYSLTRGAKNEFNV